MGKPCKNIGVLKQLFKRIREYVAQDKAEACALKLLETRLRRSGKSISSISFLVHDILTGKIQDPGLREYKIPVEYWECREAVYSVITSREVSHLILAGLSMEEQAERVRPLRNMRILLWHWLRADFLLPRNVHCELLDVDYPLYGGDEVFGQYIARLYGREGQELFGYLDAEKHGLIKSLDQAKGCNVYLDDLVCGIVSAACSKLWTQHRCVRKFKGDLCEVNKKLLCKWMQSASPDFTLETIVQEAKERQSKYNHAVTDELCWRGLEKVLGKMEVWVSLQHAYHLSRTATDFPPVIRRKMVMDVVDPITKIYGFIGNTNPSLYIIKRPKPFEKIQDDVLLYVLASIQSAVNAFVAHNAPRKMTWE